MACYAVSNIEVRVSSTSSNLVVAWFGQVGTVRGQAKAVVTHIPAAIGMNAAISDNAARVFAAQFYSAIGFGHSITRAFQQARAALMLEGIPEENTPELFVAPGLDGGGLTLVRINLS
jgi:hypothetical protein